MNIPFITSLVLAVGYSASGTVNSMQGNDWKKVKVDASVSVFLPSDMKIQQLRSAGVYGLQFSNDQMVIDLELGHKNLNLIPTELISGKKASIVSLNDDRSINGVKARYRVELGVGTLVMKAYVGSESAKDVAKQIFRAVEISY